MKKSNLISITIICSILHYAATLSAQQSDWFLKGGAGYLIMNHIEQTGFSQKGPSFIAFAELGKTNNPISIGYQQTIRSDHQFYRYSLKKQIQCSYAKYNFNQLISWMPLGLDPYAMVGAGIASQRFTTFEKSSGPYEISEAEEVMRKPTYTFGMGVEIGSRNLILGLHYQYIPGNDKFNSSEGVVLPFATTNHLISATVAFRYIAHHSARGTKCPRFGQKGLVRF